MDPISDEIQILEFDWTDEGSWGLVLFEEADHPHVDLELNGDGIAEVFDIRD